MSDLYVCSDRKVSDEHKKREFSPKMKKSLCAVGFILTALVAIITASVLIFHPLSIVLYVMACIILMLVVCVLVDDSDCAVYAFLGIVTGIFIAASVLFIRRATLEMLTFELIASGIIAVAIIVISTIASAMFYRCGKEIRNKLF